MSSDADLKTDFFAMAATASFAAATGGMATCLDSTDACAAGTAGTGTCLDVGATLPMTATHATELARTVWVKLCIVM
ncbi:MAG: hypothetical protein V4864_01830 [Pseudomonadota bacterium]